MPHEPLGIAEVHSSLFEPSAEGHTQTLSVQAPGPLIDVSFIGWRLADDPVLPADLVFMGEGSLEIIWSESFDPGFGENFDWHECLRIKFFPLRPKEEEKILAASPLPAEKIDWEAAAGLLKKGGCNVADSKDAQCKVNLERMLGYEVFTALERVIGFISLFSKEGIRVLEQWREVSKPLSVALNLDNPKDRAAEELTQHAMRLVLCPIYIVG